MAKVRYTVRFYRQHDYDLLLFSIQNRCDLIRMLYKVLKAFSKGQSFIVTASEPLNKEMPEFRRAYTRALVLDDEKDADQIALLSRIKDGYRNNFFRTILRIYICSPVPSAFLADESTDLKFFEDLTEQAFRKGRKMVKVGQDKPIFRKRTHSIPKAELNSAQASPVRETPAETQIDKTVEEHSTNHVSPDESNELLDVFASLMGN